MDTTPNQTSGILNPPPNNEQPVVPVDPPKRKRRLLKALITTLVVVMLAGVGVLNQSAITDYLVARTISQPSAQSQLLASDLELTPRGKDIFYSSEPNLADSSSNFPCQSSEGNSVILGCYSSTESWIDKGQIYILNVKNNALDGVVQVTAAHEMLHAAYHRLNFFEKATVDKMLRDEYQKIKDQPAIKEQMEYYKLAEPGQDLNELHSIIGTTVASIDSDLELYYARYFTDRAAVVSHYQDYFKVLHGNDEQIKILQAKLEGEAVALQRDMDRYDADLQQLNLDILSFNARANSGGFSTRGSFEVARSALMARASILNAQAESLNDRVKSYNLDVMTINSLSAETNTLYSSLKGVDTPTQVGQ